MKIQDIRIEEYDYLLPEERIAKFPLPQRDQSKLLIRRNGEISETTFSQLGEYLPAESLLLFNNTRVIQARILFRKETGALIEVFCLEPKLPTDYAQSFIQTESCEWICLVGNSKRWKSGELYYDFPDCRLSAERLESFGETSRVRFSWDNPDYTFSDILEQAGELPIPPYLNRKTEERDKTTYQTVYSKIKGSVAAPTAGLHFTPEVFDSLREKGISFEEVTLHVGAGTFKPVKSESLAGHEMHTEFFLVKRQTIQHLIEKEGRVIAVGTTSVRTLESLYYLGLLLEANPNLTPDQLNITQWMPYEEQPDIPVGRALENIRTYMDRNQLEVIPAYTQILIAPGYRFRIVKGIITNFHQPRSTLLLLISAFVDGNWQSLYDYALAHNFRFLSYGDSSLLLREC